MYRPGIQTPCITGGSPTCICFQLRTNQCDPKIRFRISDDLEKQYILRNCNHLFNENVVVISIAGKGTF